MSVVKKRRYPGGGRKHLQLYTNVKRSAAYYSLSVYARCALIELIDRFNGCNNGMIGLGVRELADELQCSHGTAVNAFRELDDAGLAHPVTLGRYPGKRATEWRLTFKRCDATGELPILNWQSRPEGSRRRALKVRRESASLSSGHVGKRKRQKTQ